MKILESVPVEVMVAAFLQAEVNSPRFAEPILRLLARDRRDRHILDAPDLTATDENAYRARLLREWRGYERNEDVFTDLPDDTQWFRALLERADLERVKYINDDYWTGFSGGSRFIRDAVARIRSGEIDSGEAACYVHFAGALAEGMTFPDPVLLVNPRTEELVVMEGHIRMTSYLLWVESRADRFPLALPVILGISERIQK